MNKIIENTSHKPMRDYILYGKHVVLSALNNPKRRCRELVLTKQLYEELNPIARDDMKITFASNQEIDKLVVHGAIHQGIILKTYPLQQPSLKEFLKNVGQKTSTIVILDKIYDPQNLGAILRSCVAFEVDAVIIPKNHSVAETALSAKASCGAIELIPMIVVANITEAISLLKQQSYWVMGMDMDGEKSFHQVVQCPKLAMIFGNEGEGLRRLTKANCDFLVAIPISEKVESLNISNAVAISLFARSQRLILQ